MATENPFKKSGANPFKKGGGGSSSAKPEKKKEKGFLGWNLPTIGLMGHDLVDLPAIGVHTDKKNPLTQVEDLVTGFPAGLAALGQELVAGTTKFGKDKNNPGGWAGVKKTLPITASIVESPVKTAKTLNPQDLLDVAKGRSEDTAMAKRIRTEGILGTALATVGDLSLIGGGVAAIGKVAGAGDLAKAANLERAVNTTSKAAGLGKVGNVEALTAEATKAAGAGNIEHALDLQKAVDQLGEAGKLRAEGTTIPARITEGAQTVGRLGAELGNAPAKPFQYLGKGIGKVGEGTGAVLSKTKTGTRLLKRSEDFIKYSGDKLKIADMYHRIVTAKSQEALYRQIDRGEAPEAIRAGLTSHYPDLKPVFDSFADDLQPRVEAMKSKIPRGEVGHNTPNLLAEIRSKTPAEWAEVLEPLEEKLKAAKAHRAALPDAHPTMKGANKAVRMAEAEVKRVRGMRTMSTIEPEFLPEVPPPAHVEEALMPEKPAARPDAEPTPDTAGGPSFEEVQQFNKENVKALRVEFHNQLQESFAPGMTVDTVVPQANVPGSMSLNMDDILKARGYTAWDPMTGMEVKGQNITGATKVLPNQVFDTVKRYSEFNRLDKANSSILRAYDAATGKWKHTVLALSPRWHFGNVVGNLAMAAAAGLNPLEIVKYGIEARKLVKAGHSPAELLSSGFHFSEESLGALAAGQPTGITGALKHPIQWSYSMNQYVDDVNRTMIYLAKKSEGMSGQAAVQMALKAAGDFGRLTPLEKNVMRRIMPFYAWQKHITKLAFRLPLEAPARVAWTLHLAETGMRMNPDEGAEGFNKNTIGLGGLRLDLRSSDPFGSSMLASGLGKEAVGRSLNPLVSLGTAAGLGKSAMRGFENVRTPDVQFGEKGTPLLQEPGSLLQYLGQQIPQVRQTQNLVAGKTKTRYDTGEESETQYPDDAQNRWQQLLGMLGVNLRPNLKGEASKKVTHKKGASDNPFAGGKNPFKK